MDDRFISLMFKDAYEETITKKYFSYKDTSKAFTGGSYNSMYIRDVCFLKKKGKYSFLYSGFLQDLLFFIKEKKIKVEELHDKRTKFEYQKKQYIDEELASFFPKFNYIEHQKKILRTMLKASIGIIKSPTSSGKSEIMIAFIKATRMPTLILVNRISLALQMKDRILKNGIKSVGVVYGNANETGDIVISTIGSVKKIHDLHKFKILMVDEVHRAQSNQFQDFLEKVPYSIRFGFSATPDSGDDYKWAKIRQFMGNVICEIEADELIENEVIALPKIHFVDIQCPPTMDWPSANWKCIVENYERNKKIKELVDLYKVPTLILIRNIEHGQILNSMINGSVFVSGIDDALKRKEIIEDFENGKLDVIISSNVFNEGISINAIRLLIIASGGKSKIETIQKLGRGLRITDNKKEVLVYDFLDLGNYFTERHSKTRRNIYRKCGFK